MTRTRYYLISVNDREAGSIEVTAAAGADVLVLRLKVKCYVRYLQHKPSGTLVPVLIDEVSFRRAVYPEGCIGPGDYILGAHSHVW